MIKVILSHRGAKILCVGPANSVQRGSTVTVLAVDPVLVVLRDPSQIFSVRRAERTVLAILDLKHILSTTSASAACVQQESSTHTRRQPMSPQQLGVASPAGMICSRSQGPCLASAMPVTSDLTAGHAKQESTRLIQGQTSVKTVLMILQLGLVLQSVSVMWASNLAAAFALHVLQASTRTSLQT